MNPVMVQLGVNLLEAAIGTGVQLFNQKLEIEAEKRTHNLRSKEIEKQLVMLRKFSKSTLKSSHPITPDPGVSSMPPEEEPTEISMDEVHHQKWDSYFEAIHELPEEARPTEVRNVIREIEHDIKNYPCKECKENSKEHLKDMIKEGNRFSDVNSKNEAITKLCDFKNKINASQGKEIFNCNSLIS